MKHNNFLAYEAIRSQMESQKEAHEQEIRVRGGRFCYFVLIIWFCRFTFHRCAMVTSVCADVFVSLCECSGFGNS